MLTSADDYPIHQTPEPIAIAHSERNFYDRYFFNGYRRDGSLFFACALGVYPQLGVMDAAFSVIHDGVQHNLRASRSSAHLDRMDTRVGPLAVRVVEPLHKLAVAVDAPDHDLRTELTFTGRCPPVQEPRFTRREGTRLFMDTTRMTQPGQWHGFIEVAGDRVAVEPDAWVGTRDRSWGVRPVGARDPQGARVAPQFYWLWAPLQFADCATFYHVNTDAAGNAWSRFGGVVDLAAGAEAATYPDTSSTLRFRDGTRHADGATLRLSGPDHAVSIELSRHYDFFMSGLGYLHPAWGHGIDRGELDVGKDTIVLADADPNHPLHLHVQTLCDAVMTRPDGSESHGIGVLEQLILGPHEPSGLRGLVGPS